MIKVKNLSKSFFIGKEEQRVLKNINLEIRDNEIISIMGPSGGGKSTLLQILGLLSEAEHGEIYIDDEKINYKKKKVMEKIRREKIGFIFQNPNLISSLNVMENLIIAMNNNKSYKEKSKTAKKLLDSVGLSKKYKASVSSISGGEAQRAAIVRSLVNDPKIIFCDEPTGALDSRNGENVMKLLKEINAKRNCTIIIVTHDAKVADIAHRKFLLKDGELNEIQ